MRTAVYIDGFNVYYRLKGSPHKWLDYESLAKSFLSPSQELRILKYFTARVNGRFDPGAPTRQDAYLRALKAYNSGIEIFEGSFLISRKRARFAGDPEQFVDVLNSEEKGSDVNLAVHLLNDACHDAFDVAYVMSNDTDLAEAIRLTIHDHGKQVGLIVPVSQPAGKLRAIANPVYRCRLGRMGQHQLPDRIPNTTIHKPQGW